MSLRHETPFDVFISGNFVADVPGMTYRYAHDEPNAYAAGETYLPEGMEEPRWYEPTPRGLEVKIGEKLTVLRKWDEDANNRGKS